MKTVLFDVDTQLDFVFPAGALAVPGAESIVENLGKLTRYAASHSLPLISTADAHTEDDPEFEVWKPHCVAGTTGQQKCAATVLSPAKIIASSADQQLPTFGSVPQVIVEKQMLDCFANPNLRPLLQLWGAQRFILYGLVSEYCVQCAALGLLETGARVELVTDAIRTLEPRAERTFRERFRTRGGHFTTTAEIMIA